MTSFFLGVVGDVKLSGPSLAWLDRLGWVLYCLTQMFVNNVVRVEDRVNGRGYIMHGDAVACPSWRDMC